MITANKRIAINTLITYSRLIITTLVGLLSTRYVLLALGESDFGLYSVLGGILAMLNMLSVAMYTTTRRYINVEMGKPDGNLNKIFNVSLLLHVMFGLLIFVLAEIFGIYYISNYLNVVQDKLPDAYFVFHISTFTAILGLINVPYQGLLNAYEKFGTIAIIEIIGALLKIPLIICLINYQGNVLRFYAVGMALLSIVTFLYYQIITYKKYHHVVTFKIYRDHPLYKEILSYNNYVAVGAFAFMGRCQGVNILVNFFFGTIVNAAFAIAYAVENYVQQFVSCISTPFEPQIIQNWVDGNRARSLKLVESSCRYSTLICLLLIFPLFVNMDFILELWVKAPPDGASLLCRLILLGTLFRLQYGLTSPIRANGNIKKLQIFDSITSLIGLPIALLLFYIGYNSYTVIIIYLFIDIIKIIGYFYLLHRQLRIDVLTLYRNTYSKINVILLFLVIGAIICEIVEMNTFLQKVTCCLVSLIYVLILEWIIGFNQEERKLVFTKVNQLVIISE